MMASNGGGSTSSIVAYNMNFNQEGGYWSNAMSKENYKAKVYLTPSNSLSEINRAYAYSIRCLVKQQFFIPNRGSQIYLGATLFCSA